MIQCASYGDESRRNWGEAMRSRFRPAPAAVLLLAVFFSQALHAGTACDSPDVIKYLPPLPAGCQIQRIEATGGLTFGIVHSPQQRAEAAWRRRVVFLFGERYQDWQKAACKKVYCVHPLIAGSRRCVYSAFPCASDTDAKLLEALNAEQPVLPEPQHDEVLTKPAAHGEAQTAPGPSQRLEAAQPAPEIDQRHAEAHPVPGLEPPHDEALTAAEIKEMQELLARAGYRVVADGVFGDRTKNALIKWQQRRGLPENGTASRENLEKLRHMPGAGSKGVDPQSKAAQFSPRYRPELPRRRQFTPHGRPADRGATIRAGRRRAKEPAWRRPDSGRFAESLERAFGFLSSLEASGCAASGLKDRD
jgi:Putative peptidoglycan binding domain